MKRYILFVNNISGIGGAQLYILRKVKHLIMKDYKVHIITGQKDPIILKEFNDLNILVVPEILYIPSLFNSRIRKDVLTKITDFVSESKSNKEIYIESHQTSPALWAELTGAIINAPNIVYAIAPLSLKRKVYKDFFLEKLKKEELLGCNKSYIKSNFSSITNVDNYISNYINIPFDKSEIEILDCQSDKSASSDLKILSISRISKTYLKHSIMKIIDFAEKNPQIKIQYNIYTDKNEGEKHRELKELIKKSRFSNLVINLNGPVNPLNSCIFHDQDVFIGMGTSILNASSMKIPSLVVDYRNNKYFGFFGRDYFEFGPGEKLAENELEVYLDYIIKHKEEIHDMGDLTNKFFVEEFESNNVNDKFLSYVNTRSNEHKHTLIPKRLMDIRDLIDFTLIKTLGAKKSIVAKQQIIKIMNRKKNHL